MIEPLMVEPLIAMLDANQREQFEERAGIMQFDGGMTKQQAECLALMDVLRRNPAALLGITILRVEFDGGTQWLLTTDLAYARRYLLDIGAVEVGVPDLGDVINEQYGGIARLTELG